MDTNTHARYTADAPKKSTAVPIEVGMTPSQLPEWLEVPDAMRHFGLKRTALYNYLRIGQIKSILLKRPGGRTGKRLVNSESIRFFFAKVLEGQESYHPGRRTAQPEEGKSGSCTAQPEEGGRQATNQTGGQS